MSVQFVDFKNDCFTDFKSVLLPNIYEECISSRVLAEDGLFCVGAVQDGAPVGAVVARLSAERELDIASIYVKEAFRRRGIGSGLVDALLSAAVALLDESSPLENPNISLLVSCEYALPEAEAAAFKQFLTAKDFTMHTEYGKLLVLEPEVLKALAEKSGAGAKAYPQDADLAALEDMFAAAGISLEEKLCFYAGEPEDPEALAAVAYGFEGLQLISKAVREDFTPEGAKSLLAGVLQGIAAAHPGEALLINLDCNIEAFYGLLQGQAELCIHGHSLAALGFEAGEEEL